ncbi:MAG TPA: hypothetical protein VFU47_04885, partial [Armatimonadota bacterium]|nr:hypothetical protein [Armatimonadota bacterium]
MGEELTVEVDPLASMRCWAIELELGGRTYEVPALPAVDWWPVLVSADLGQILDFVVSTPEDPFNLDDLLLDGAFTTAELTQALTDALEEVAGRSFHAAFVLATVANSQWAAINGAMVQGGFRWDEQPLGAALDAIYAVVTGRLNEEALKKFLALLDNEALTTGGKPTPRQRAKVETEFESMAGPKPTAGVVATGARSGSGRPKTQPRLQRPRQGGRSGAPKRQPGPPAGSDPG